MPPLGVWWHVYDILRYILFADDTSIFMSHKDPLILQTIFNIELIKISKWLYMNKLSINTSKTHFMMFTNKNIDIDQITIKLAGSEINLGITTGNKLTIRIIFHATFLAHTTPIFYSLKYLTIYDMYQYQLGIIMFLCHEIFYPRLL